LKVADLNELPPGTTTNASDIKHKLLEIWPRPELFDLQLSWPRVDVVTERTP
jgi:hypothetical protein